MSYTFSDQQDKLSSIIGDSEEGSSAMFPIATRKKELNRGELNFAIDSKVLTEYTTSTVASGEITVPTDWIETYILTVNNKVITNDREVSLSDYERYYNAGDTNPYYYFWEFSGVRKIKFFGSPNDSTYQLWYFQKPTTELSDDSDTSLLPEEYREGPVFYAASELLTQIGKTELADYYRNKYEFWVSRAKVKFEEKYVDKEYARPDFGDQRQSTTDVQGGGRIVY